MRTQKRLAQTILDEDGDCVYGERKLTQSVQKYPVTICSRVSQAWIWQNSSGFP
jgi:hypothetical protein